MPFRHTVARTTTSQETSMALESKKVIRLLRVPAGKPVRLSKYDPAWEGADELRSLGKDELKERAKRTLERNVGELAAAQELLWASDRYAVLVIFQAMDAAGKDGTIKHVMSGVNPQGCQVTSFKQPSVEELDHEFLWRAAKALPERGRIGIFNRSYYEEVLVVRVHPEFLERQKLPPGERGKKLWKERYDDINAFERHLVRNGTVVVKFFLNVSKDEQKRRFFSRLDDPRKHWKFSAADLAERAHWDEYMSAYEEMLSATSTPWAPWYVIPADHKFITRALVAGILTHTIQGLELAFPEVAPSQKKVLEAARQALATEDAPRAKREPRGED
jgi:PPK2 family polyphosphate:nucleotide phosphotransferase